MHHFIEVIAAYHSCERFFISEKNHEQKGNNTYKTSSLHSLLIKTVLCKIFASVETSIIWEIAIFNFPNAF